MKILQDVSITTQHDGMSDEVFSVTYDPIEQENNIVNAENSKHIFSPKFVPFYGDLMNSFDLTYPETIIFGFIDFYISSSSNRFYFTNEQLAYIAKCSEDTASRAISRLEKVGLIKTKRRIMSGGGQIRFIQRDNSDLGKTRCLTWEKLQTNKNKINKNSNIPNGICEDSPETNSLLEELEVATTKVIQVPPKVPKSYGNADINLAKEWLAKKYPKPLNEINDRIRLKNFIQALSPRKGKDEWMSKDWKENLINFTKYYLTEDRKGYEAEGLYKLNQIIQAWREKGIAVQESAIKTVNELI